MQLKALCKPLSNEGSWLLLLLLPLLLLLLERGTTVGDEGAGHRNGPGVERESKTILTRFLRAGSKAGMEKACLDHKVT